jgi:hypothetical protein
LLSSKASYVTNGVEYAIAGTKPGDQVHPALALGPNGGFLVWEDNITTSSGLGISAQRLDSSFSSALSSFRVNSSNVGDNERAQVALLNNGGAVFVWQGGSFGFQHIYARFLSSSNTWMTDDVLVNSSTNQAQLNPAVATLGNGNVAIVWNSFNQYSPTSMQDVYGQVLSPDGQKVGGEFLVNQFVNYNQRTPTVAALSTGGFVVAWVSEQQRTIGVINPQLSAPAQMTLPSVDIYARQFSSTGLATANEFLVNTGIDACANPSIAPAADGGFVVAWGQKDGQLASNGWDVFARVFPASGVNTNVTRVNVVTEGDQIGPRISGAGNNYLMVWTSRGQDNSMEGVFGRFLNSDTSPNGSEFQVNTTWMNKQMHPAVSSDGNGSFLVAWTSFVGGSAGFDLFAQRYVSDAQALTAMAAPFVFVPFIANNGVYQPQIVVSWPAQSGLSVDHYEVYVDGTLASSPNTNIWTMTSANGLAASSTHSFQVDAVIAGGGRTPLSPAATATTWGGFNWAGIPFEWMSQYYGMDSSLWPAASAALGQGGPTLYQVFLTGGNPLDSSTWLRTSLSAQYVQGQPVYVLHWNTHPGLIYQVQTSSDMATWTDLQSPRLAADVSDSVPVPKNNLQYYRIVRLR